MQVAIHTYRTDLKEAFTRYVERRLRFALQRYGGRVGRVMVRISANGPAEASCRISTAMLPFGRIAVEETHSDLFVAIDRATRRIGWLFGRKLERAREASVGPESIRLAA